MRLSSLFAREDGYSLPELLVAVAMGGAVLIGLGTVMSVTLHQTQRTLTRVDATRQARIASANLENSLHSACTGSSNTDPIQIGSGPSELMYLSYTGDDDTPTPIWNDLKYNPSVNGSVSTLTDATSPAVPSTSASSGWAANTDANTTTKTLLTNVAPLNGASVFRYYAYTPTAVGSATYWTILDGSNALPGTSTVPGADQYKLSTPLSQSDANVAVEVLVSLSVGASTQNITNNNLSLTSAPINDAISLRLTTPPNYTSGSDAQNNYGPCQ